MKNVFFVLLWLLLSISLPASAVEDARNFDAVLENLIAHGDQLVHDYRPDDSLNSSAAFSRLYFDQFESSGLEFRLAAYDATLTSRIELGFTGLIQNSLRGVPVSAVAEQWQNLRQDLQQIDTRQLNSESWLGNFIQSLLILLREGIEAILLIALLISVLQRGGHGDQVALIGYGAASAVLASIALAYGLQQLLSHSGQARELIEGLVLLAAAALLTYVSLWLISQREAQQWQQFLHQQLEQQLARRNQLAIFVMAFVAVFREGAETILFYQALLIDSQSFTDALWAGAGVAALLLLGFYAGLQQIIRRVRLSLFFRASAMALLLMAVVFTGKGIMELQAAGWMPVTAWPQLPVLPLLGIFPTLETSVAQLLILTAFITLLLWFGRRQRLAEASAEA